VFLGLSLGFYYANNRMIEIVHITSLRVTIIDISYNVLLENIFVYKIKNIHAKTNE